jgi:tripartite-type tricarboxylate transporter receptor subunit TctC
MMLARRRFLALCAASPLIAVAPVASRAGSYPSRPIRVIVPYAAGGPNDTIARIITAEAFRHEGASFVIENIA